ncbi:dihydroorotase [Pseudobdellovibrio sp. HCB154]|uniref:dihydroorotase n=1 Tax=Pseudobdellovibrio sp. HCB154 TaxID=3386277 RepID=UPI0039174FF7
MATFDLIIKNADIVTFSESQNQMVQEKTDIAVLNGKIEKLGTLSAADAAQVIDATHLTVLPGVIDSQVHFREPGLTHKEDIESGSRAAILGGVTTYFEMPNTNPPTTTKALFEDKLKIASEKSSANYAFFIGGGSENFDQLAELEKLPHCSGIKIFLGSSFGTLLVDQDELLEKIMKNGRRRLVIHAEDEARLKERKQIAIDAADAKVHHIWRDEESALIATKKSVHLSEKHQRHIHILHISSSEEMAFLRNAKEQQLRAFGKSFVTVEILPQYLTLSAPECYERLGSLWQQNPPIRDKRHMEFLWKAVLDGTVDVIGSDHAPHTLEEKAKTYPNSPSGVPGVQTLVPLMLDQVNKNKLPLKRFVELVTENPRKVFNLKNKGRIQVGYDADFTIIDMKKEKTVEKKWLASKTGWSPFEGQSFKGWPVMTLLKGEVVVDGDMLIKPRAGTACDFGI